MGNHSKAYKILNRKIEFRFTLKVQQQTTTMASASIFNMITETDLTKMEIEFKDKQERTMEGEFVMMKWGKDMLTYEMYQFPIVRLFAPAFHDVSDEIDQHIVELYK